MPLSDLSSCFDGTVKFGVYFVIYRGSTMPAHALPNTRFFYKKVVCKKVVLDCTKS